MKKTTVLKFSLLLMPFLLGFVHSEDPFEELNTSRSVESVQEFDQQITSTSSVNSRYVVIDKQFWNGNYSKLVEVESFEQSFPPGDFPTQTDFFIKFDEKS